MQTYFDEYFEDYHLRCFALWNGFIFFMALSTSLKVKINPFPLQKTLRSFSPKHHEVFLKTLDVFEKTLDVFEKTS